MPRLWDDTIEAHRHAVREAILDTVGRLVAERGLGALTMSRIASDAGIGRATLYKYFHDVEAVVLAWHQRQVSRHVDELTHVADRPGSARRRLEAVLHAFATISQGHPGSDLSALLHRGDHVAGAERQLLGLISDLVTEGARAGDLRDDVAPDELARYCLHALTAAKRLPSKAAVQRLVEVTLAGLRRASSTGPASAKGADRG